MFLIDNIFFHVLWTCFSTVSINCLCLSLLCIKYILSGNSAAQEIKHLWKFTSGFFGRHILNFERNLSLSPRPQCSLVPFCIISLGGPVYWYQLCSSSRRLVPLFVRDILHTSASQEKGKEADPILSFHVPLYRWCHFSK